MFQPENIAVMIPIVALLIPIVALLTRHQRSMAELIHGSHHAQQGQAASAELQALRAEVSALRETVNMMIVNRDGLPSSGLNPQLGNTPPAFPAEAATNQDRV
ncbi:MAG TPA: hypothetical protein PLB31_09950 [Fimbriimonadaceae bacterium]|nr:hypothetical protein [Armatimonadota bacterium]HCM72686.1 hypothetical protein [Armatimonadota bacterium]HRD30333.1 hypothetical protein [Fimbriimonadaceae bacterium]HRE94062.1 hypothetical protein [Fimbriimonadaceae bacterium]HRI74777.1 hypothetical protein [Fimbriimonadaceae bacterium]